MFAALSIGLLCIVLTATIHYAAMLRVVAHARLSSAPRLARFVFVMLAASIAHLIEAALWAGALGLGLVLELGTFEGSSAVHASDIFAFSLVNFATLGLGVLTPSSDLKFIAAMGALNGFLLITCSASFVHQVVTPRE